MQVDEHLFRREAGRMVGTLTHIFGVHNLALAEDVVQDAFCRALEVWKFRGVPENPSAWLMKTAKNRALDILRRERTATTFAPELGRLLQSEWTLAPVVEEIFGPASIKDDQLRMMFSCCQPRLREEAQVALILNILCGFSVEEVAQAFVSGRAAIEKRILRAKKVLKGSKRMFEMGSAEDFPARLTAVQRALYLLFNEGYHGASPESPVRVDLCQEAIRLTRLLLECEAAAVPETFALLALMCLHAARLPARLNAAGNLATFVEQDRTRWDAKLAIEGQRLLDLSATGQKLTEYHIEAAIAATHAKAARAEDTDWTRIVWLYEKLARIRPSPIVALNRAIAIAQLEGPERGLAEIRAIADQARLEKYPFYAAAMGEMEFRLGEFSGAEKHFREALALARNPMERQFLEQRSKDCAESASVVIRKGRKRDNNFLRQLL
jgi:RNA polymerase sigma factor (sigma-70 family)